MPKWYSRLELYITYKFNKCIRKLYTNTFVTDELVQEAPVTLNFYENHTMFSSIRNTA